MGRSALSSVSLRGLTVRLSPLMEAEMQAVILAFVGGAALAAVSAQAAPLAPTPRSAPLPTFRTKNGRRCQTTRLAWRLLVRRSRLSWCPKAANGVGIATIGPTIGAYWHWGDRVPSGGLHTGGGARGDHPYADWRGPSGSWGKPL